MSNAKWQRGFTLVEMAIVVAIIGILTAASWMSLSAARPRQTMAAAMAEVQVLLNGARQQALASGHDVVVLVFPVFANPQGGQVRFVAFEDRDSVALAAASAFAPEDYEVDFKGRALRSDLSPLGLRQMGLEPWTA